MKTWKSTDVIGSGEKFDTIQYVNDNYDDYEDGGWGLNLMNLEEVTGQEMIDENMKEILPKLISEAGNKKKIIIMEKNGEKKGTDANDEKRSKEDEERCREEMNQEEMVCRWTLVFISLFIEKKWLVNLQTLSLYWCV